MNKDFNHSYWEFKQYFRPFDLIVIGAGIVGLSSAISCIQKHRKLRILVLERGVFPEGASTKNAGFACFGSAGELLDDLKHQSPEQVWDMVKMRWKGLTKLRNRLGDKELDYKSYGGYEMFNTVSEADFVTSRLPELNAAILDSCGLKTCFRLTRKQLSGFRGFQRAILNSYEGQLDSGKMMHNLQKLSSKLDIKILYNCTVNKIIEQTGGIEIESSLGTFKGRTCLVATNGFASQLLKLPEVRPARAQVLITSPIPDLKMKGSFHLDRGYYYWRNIKDRVLLGGGRNLDIETEATSEFGINLKIQNNLDKLLKTKLLPSTRFHIEQRWSGIMGLGPEKYPIVEFFGKRTLAAVRMGGMGIAIGSEVGEMATKRLSSVL